MQVSQQIGKETGTGGPTLATAVFDHVSMQGKTPRGGWSGDDVGGSPGGLPTSGFKESGGRFTVAGSGDIAPAVGGSGGGQTIERSLVGAFAGLIAVIVVATLFITAEYRRGLIRTTLAASPRRGRVLAAKAIVIGSVTFAAGLVTAALAVPLGERILRDNGNYLYPVSSLTELRVVAGTAALLAVAAIQQSIPQYPQVSSICTPSQGCYPLAPWTGFAVLCAWAALVLGLAVFLLRRRDA